MGWQVTFNGTKRDLTVRVKELEKDPYASIWEGGKVVDFDDLSPDLFDVIAKAEPLSGNWWNVYRYPGATASRLHAVLTATAQHAGVEVPSKPLNMREANALVEMLEATEEPGPREGGFPTTPSETETTSSTGPSNDSDGSPAPPDEND